MQYLNSTCIDSALNFKYPASINAKIIHNNCISINTDNSYLTLGNSNNFSDVKKLEFKFKFLQTSNTDHVLFSGFKPDVVSILYSNDLQYLLLQQNTACKIISIPKLKTNISEKSISDYLFDDNWHTLSIIFDDNISNYQVKIDNNICDITENASSYYNPNSEITVFGTLFENSQPIGNLNGMICDIKCFNNSDELIHWYPCAEGSGTIIYDAVGNINGELINTGTNLFWNATQDIFAYNTVNGYGKILNNDAFIPLNSNLNIEFAEQYPKVQNGHNKSESHLSWTHDIDNIAEFKNINNISDYVPFSEGNDNIFKIQDNNKEYNYIIYKIKESGINLMRINNKIKFYDYDISNS